MLPNEDSEAGQIWVRVSLRNGFKVVLNIIVLKFDFK